MNHNMLWLTWYLSTYTDDIFQLKFLWPQKKKKGQLKCAQFPMYCPSLKQFAGNFY